MECKSVLGYGQKFNYVVLIETLWNVNQTMKSGSDISTSINRNIVECKCYSHSQRQDSPKVLIETLWNVNLLSPVIVFDRIIVLIETLWNVNSIEVFNLLEEAFRINRNIVECKYARMPDYPVLIETLWNVNQVLYRKQKDIRSINRNIVECKFRINRNPLVLITVLIETLWNVNEHSDRKEWHKRVCINRNIVECKSGTGAVSAMPYAY